VPASSCAHSQIRDLHIQKLDLYYRVTWNDANH
jgi:hypothetical protein